jgi:hypothetical protein
MAFNLIAGQRPVKIEECEDSVSGIEEHSPAPPANQPLTVLLPRLLETKIILVVS